MKRSERT